MDKNTKNWLYEFEAKTESGEIKKFAVLKANRRMREDGELFYSSEVSRFAKAGILPKAAWNTILSDGGGSISEKDRELYGNLLMDFRDKSFDLQAILIKNVSERSEDEQLRSTKLIEELEDIKQEIQGFEASQISIFENTAESKARNRAILWWVMNLAYKKEGDTYELLFDGNSFNDKLDLYDSLEEDATKHAFLLGVLRRITYLITLWFLGRAENTEDMKSFDDMFLKDNNSDSEEAPVDKASTEGIPTEKASVESKPIVVEEKIVVTETVTEEVKEVATEPVTQDTTAA